MVDVVIATGSEDKVASSSENLPDEYYEDLAGALQDGYKKTSDVHAWLEVRKRKICKYYNLHEEDDRLQYDQESSDDEDMEYLRGDKPGQIPTLRLRSIPGPGTEGGWHLHKTMYTP